MSNGIGSWPDAEHSSDPERTVTARDVEAELDELHAESAERAAELRRIAANVPAVMSRRTVLVAMLGDLRRAPDRWTVLRRVVSKVGRLPAEMLRKVSRA